MNTLLLVLHSVVDLVASGRSIVRVAALIVAACTFGILFFVRGRSRRAAHGPHAAHQPHVPRWFLPTFFSVLGALFVFGIGVQVYVTHVHGISAGDFTVFFNEREITSTTLTHSHVLKVLPYSLAHDLFGVTYAENADIGGGIAPFLPPWVTWIGLLLCAFVGLGQLYAAWAHMPDTRPSHSHGHDNVYTRGRIIGWCVLFILAQFALVKCIIDGGLFAEKVYLWIAVEYALLASAGQWKRISIGFWVAWAVTLVSNGIFWLTDVFPVWQFEQRIILETGLIIILALAVRAVYGLRLQRVHILAGIFGLVCIVPYLLSETEVFSYRAISINGYTPAIVGTYNPDASGNTLLSVGKLSYQRVQATTTIGVIDDAMDINDSYEPVSVEWKTCLPREPQHEIDFLIHTDVVPSHIGVHNDQFTFILRPTVAGSNTYQATLFVNPCLPRPLNLVNELGLSLGLHTWYIWNIIEHNDRRTASVTN